MSKPMPRWMYLQACEHMCAAMLLRGADVAKHEI